MRVRYARIKAQSERMLGCQKETIRCMAAPPEQEIDLTRGEATLRWQMRLSMVFGQGVTNYDRCEEEGIICKASKS